VGEKKGLPRRILHYVTGPDWVGPKPGLVAIWVIGRDICQVSPIVTPALYPAVTAFVPFCTVVIGAAAELRLLSLRLGSAAPLDVTTRSKVHFNNCAPIFCTETTKAPVSLDGKASPKHRGRPTIGRTRYRSDEDSGSDGTGYEG
jgi:hypothetical protein